MTARTKVITDFWLHATVSIAEPTNHPDSARHRSRLAIGVPMAVARQRETEEEPVRAMPPHSHDSDIFPDRSRPACTGMVDRLIALLSASGAGPFLDRQSTARQR